MFFYGSATWFATAVAGILQGGHLWPEWTAKDRNGIVTMTLALSIVSQLFVANVVAFEFNHCILLQGNYEIDAETWLKCGPPNLQDQTQTPCVGYYSGSQERNPPPWWRHQMKKNPYYWPFVSGSHRSPEDSPHKGQWHGSLVLMYSWTNCWTISRVAGTPWCPCDVTGMTYNYTTAQNLLIGTAIILLYSAILYVFYVITPLSGACGLKWLPNSVSNMNTDVQQIWGL